MDDWRGRRLHGGGGGREKKGGVVKVFVGEDFIF